MSDALAKARKNRQGLLPSKLNSERSRKSWNISASRQIAARALIFIRATGRKMDDVLRPFDQTAAVTSKSGCLRVQPVAAS